MDASFMQMHGSGWWWLPFHVWTRIFLRGTASEDGSHWYWDFTIWRLSLSGTLYHHFISTNYAEI